MKNTQENLSTLTIWSRNVTTSTREPLTCAWIRADIWRQDGAICSKNRKIVPYHRCPRIPRLTVSVPDYGSWTYLIFNALWEGLPATQRSTARPCSTPSQWETSVLQLSYSKSEIPSLFRLPCQKALILFCAFIIVSTYRHFGTGYH